MGESLTPAIAVRYALAFEATLPPGPMVLTYDGRESGPSFLTALSDSLSKIGRAVLNCGIAATPTTGILIRQYSAVGGIQISASHNPPEYNGLKLFSAEGRVIPANTGEKVISRYREEKSLPPDGRALGEVSRLTNVGIKHLESVLAIVDAERIQKEHYRAMLDSNHGSGGLIGRPLLRSLGCRTVEIGILANGRFVHQPEPIAENLASVLSGVTEKHCQIGFCQDPDADRLAVIDENGRYLGEEYTFAICANHVLRHTPGPIVTNCSSSRMTEDLAKKYGVPFYRSAVGEANVVDAMLEHGAIFGGEGNGGVIDPRVVLVRDSFTAIALILDAMAERQMPVSALADELPRYEIVKSKIELPPEKIAAGFAALEKHFHEATVDKLDGIRFDWRDKWLLVRPSNTEPIVRAVAEAPTLQEAQRLCNEAAAVLRR